MNIHKIITIALFSVLLFSNCNNQESYITINSNLSETSSARFEYGQVFDFRFGALNHTVDSFVLLVNGQKHRTDKLNLDESTVTYGVNSLKVTYYYNGGKSIDEYGQINILSSKQEASLMYDVEKTFYHNPKSFTQGLYYENGILTESSGNYNTSFLARYPLGNNTYTTQVKVDGQYFAEGIARLGDKIYQLTWKERTVLVYDAATLELQSQMTLPSVIKEGWGICTDGKSLFITDGTQYLHTAIVADNQIQVVESKQVVGYQKLYARLNELEYIDGFIYANVWGQGIILKINPEKGTVEGVLDLSALAEGYPEEQVLNGIAYIDSQTLLVTGKYWDKMYQIRLNEPLQ